ncbi:MAG: MarR family transcriptional regulator [Eubacteriales bacterium]|nr:MarR family transcriptional regulator [Eubacteriales bacterium]
MSCMLDDRAQIGMLIKQISFQLRTLADQDLKASDLTWSQAHLLRHLVRNGGSMSQKEIEKEMEITHPTVVGLVKRLEAKGFVESSTSKEDHRVKIVCVTNKSLQHETFMHERFHEKERMMTQGMSDEEIQRLVEFLHVIHNNLEINKEG